MKCEDLVVRNIKYTEHVAHVTNKRDAGSIQIQAME